MALLLPRQPLGRISPCSSLRRSRPTATQGGARPPSSPSIPSPISKKVTKGRQKKRDVRSSRSRKKTKRHETQLSSSPEPCLSSYSPPSPPFVLLAAASSPGGDCRRPPSSSARRTLPAPTRISRHKKGSRGAVLARPHPDTGPDDAAPSIEPPNICPVFLVASKRTGKVSFR